MNSRYRFVLLALSAACFLTVIRGNPSPAGVLILENGTVIEGKLGTLSGILESPLTIDPAGQVQLLVFADDGLRRIFVSKYMVSDLRESPPQPMERIQIEQRVSGSGSRIASVGPLLRIQPWDEFGRRIVTMRTHDGTINIIQGITEVTPVYCRVEALQGPRSYVWETRVATSAIPRDVLSQILFRQMDPEDSNQRLRIVRLYLDAERYRDARTELQSVIDQFPELAELEDQVQALRQLGANRLIDEIELRQAAGQHQLAWSMLHSFPDEGIAGETLIAVREIIEKYSSDQRSIEQVGEKLAAQVAALEEESQRVRLEPIVREIRQDLGVNTLGRMADYLRLADAEELETDQKVALAISGWVLGSNSATENLAVAISLYDVRSLVVAYLQAERINQRREIFEKLSGLEGATVGYVAKLLAHMKPAIVTEPQENEVPGLLSLSIPGVEGQEDIVYHVQLPPEYDPYRKYPVVVTLGGSSTTPEQQIDWWAGGYNDELEMRTGQASRRGWIVIAPAWRKQYQQSYQFSAEEHASVLYSLRDACRRFSIDSDKVFLSGHSMGGVAAWDIGLAHPDLWAGVLPIVPRSDKYIPRYVMNAKLVPLYFVVGELDGNVMAENSQEFDRYLRRNHHDVTVIEYKGRGHEHFHDEIQRLFYWMDQHERRFFPDEFEAASLRPWDNFFWWAEVDRFPATTMILPAAWPPDRGVRPAVTEGKIYRETNRVVLTTSGSQATIFLSPEMVDFEKRIEVTFNRRPLRDPIVPSVEVMLEDVRTRGDRIHPFWAAIEGNSGR